MQAHMQAVLPVLTRLTVRVTQLACFVHLVNEHVVEVRSCAGPSMYPTLALNGDVLVSVRTSTLRTFVNRTAPHVARGDLIDFISPSDPTYSVCKRVIGIEGDVLCLDPSKIPLQSSLPASGKEGTMIPSESEGHGDMQRDSKVDVDESQVSMSADQSPLQAGPFIKVPTGYVWVVGDNLSNSNDSRLYGPVPLGLVRGKILARVWPLDRAQWLTAAKDTEAVRILG